VRLAGVRSPGAVTLGFKEGVDCTVTFWGICKGWRWMSEPLLFLVLAGDTRGPGLLRTGDVWVVYTKD
jgi:hypothetical protein